MATVNIVLATASNDLAFPVADGAVVDSENVSSTGTSQRSNIESTNGYQFWVITPSDGDVYVKFGGDSVEASAGDAWLIKAGTTREFSAGDDAKKVAVIDA